MIKILLSPPQHGPVLRRDSVPPVRARRVVAAHSSSCLPSTGGRRVDHALPAKAEILDICLSEGEIKKEQTLPQNPLAFSFSRLPLCCYWGGSDEGGGHLNMKGAVCDLLQPQAVHLHATDPQHTHTKKRKKKKREEKKTSRTKKELNRPLG